MPPPLSPSGFVSTREAAKGSGYSADYLSRLARAGHVRGELVGRAWFVDLQSLAAYLAEQRQRKYERLGDLSRSRAVEYKAHQEAGRAPLPAAPPPAPATPFITIEEVRKVVKVYQEPVVSPLSPVLRPAGHLVPTLSLMTACAVVGVGVLLGSTPLLPSAGARVMTVAGTAAEGFVVIAEPLRAHIASALTRPHTSEDHPPRLAFDVAFITQSPLFNITALADVKTAVLTNNQAIKSHAGTTIGGAAALAHTTRNLGILRSGRVAADVVAEGAKAYVQFIHTLITLEARLAYGVGPVSNSISRGAVTTVGTVGAHTFSITNAGSLALRSGGSLGGQRALALAHAAFGGIERPYVDVSMPTLSLGAAAPDPGEGVEALGVLLTTMYGRVPRDVRHITHVPASGYRSAKEIAQNIVSSAAGRAKDLLAGAPAASQLAATGGADTGSQTTVAQGDAAAPGPQTLPVVISAPVTGTALSYGDLIAYNDETKAYTVAEGESAAVIGVAVEDPPVLLGEDDGGIPVLKSGRALVNVTDENGPIAPGDAVSLSRDVPGKAIKYPGGATDILGVAREAFTGEGTTTSMTVGSQKVAIGTIVVDIAPLSGGTLGSEPASGVQMTGCTEGSFWCDLKEKVISASLLTLLRYLLALLVAVGGLYIAFRTFLNDAVSGVVSVGRNPRAKASIQAMVVFNGVLAVIIAAAALAAALGILFIQV